MSAHNPIIFIPARLAATRLPQKPLLDINGEPLIVHVWRRAVKANIAPVYVAAGDQEIVDVIEKAGGKAVLTDPALPSGTDRIQAAAEIVDPAKKHDIVLNVQGDLPDVDPKIIQAVYNGLVNNPTTDISTPVALMTDPRMMNDPTAVKVVISWDASGKQGRAHYFSRATIPANEGPYYHHMGLYGYRRHAIDQFVKLPPSPLELREKLEQLRALENNMRIDIVLVEKSMAEVNTPEDLERARQSVKVVR